MAMTPGLVLDAKYRLLSELGEGAMGTVWRAEDLRLDAPVAVKLMHAGAASSPEAVARFVREAKAAANLRSPHVVQVFDFGVDEATQAPYLVMEMLEGESLRDRLTRTGPMPPRDVSRIVTHVARALLRAHEANIVHRDLKPGNIFLVQNAESELAKVLDFGIAKWATRPLLGLGTQTGTFLGTPCYMSAEQIECSKNIDFRSDLWSLAVIAVECMTGQLPFSADNLPGLALQISQGRATPPSRLGPVPDGFDAWFARAIAIDPAARFATAAEQAQALRAACEARLIQTGSPVEALRATAVLAQSPSVGPLSRTSAMAAVDGAEPSPSRRWKWLGAAAAVLGLVVAARLALRQNEPPVRADVGAPGVPGSTTVGGAPQVEAPAAPVSTASAAAPRVPRVSAIAPVDAVLSAPKPGEVPATGLGRVLPNETLPEVKANERTPAASSNTRAPSPTPSAKPAPPKPRQRVQPNPRKAAPRQPRLEAPPVATPPADPMPSAFDVPI